MTSSVIELLRPILMGDLRGWQGLPSHFSLADLTSEFPRNSDWFGEAQLGCLHHPTRFLWANSPATEAPDESGQLRVWFEQDDVRLIDLDSSGLPPRADQLQHIFAEPTTALDTWQGTLPMPHSELVFAAHGLAAFINRDTNAIWHLALFTPAPLQIYLDTLRIDMRARRHLSPSH
jgi:hypothetical protein